MIRHISLLFSSSFAGQIVPLLVLPLLSRLYSPIDFGLFSSLMAVSSVLIILCSLRYEQVIVQLKTRRQVFGLYYLLLAFLIIFSSLIFVILFLLKEGLYLFVPLIVFLFGLNAISDKVLNRYQRFGDMSILKLIKPLIENLFVICFGYLAFGYYGLAISLILSLVAVASYVLFKVYRLTKFLPLNRKLVLSGIVVAKRYIEFPKYNLPHAMINTTMSYFPFLVIPIYYGEYELGLYAFGMRIIQAPIGIISQSIYSVLYAKLSVDYRSLEKPDKKPLINILLIQLLIISFASIVLIYGKPLFLMIFSETWARSYSFICIMAPWVFLVFVVSPYACIVNVSRNQKKAFKIEMVTSLIRAGSLLVGVLFLPINESLIVFSIVSLCCVFFVLLWYFSLFRVVYV